MLEHLVQNWNVRKPVARTRGGIVATQNRIAGEAGAKVLAAGGNAVDAAVTTGFALAAVEPWNSGLGGIGFMLVYLAKEDRVEVVDFGPISPRSLDPAAYPLTGGFTSDLFTWPTVKETRAMTLMVFLMVVMASIFFLIVDSFLGWGTTWLLGL